MSISNLSVKVEEAPGSVSLELAHGYILGTETLEFSE
jgi:hypothetical protein